MRRAVGRHPDGDAGASVQEEDGQFGRQDRRLHLVAVEVGNKVDGVRVQILQQGLGADLGQLALRVPHGGGGIGIDRAEVAVAVDQGGAGAEILREADQRIVDGHVAVGVVLPQHLADDAGALAMGAGGSEAQAGHGVQDPAVDRLEAVAGVGQCPAQYDAQGVLEEGLGDLVGQLDGARRSAARQPDQIVGRRGQLRFGRFGGGGIERSGLVVVAVAVVDEGRRRKEGQCRHGQCIAARGYREGIDRRWWHCCYEEYEYYCDGDKHATRTRTRSAGMLACRCAHVFSTC